MDQEGEPPFLKIVYNALNISLPFAAYSYVNFVLQNHTILLPHKELIQANKWFEERYANNN